MKRGPKVGDPNRPSYHASLPKGVVGQRFPPEYVDFVRRRVRAFLDGPGMSKSLEHLMSEAYIQGLRDAMEVMEHRNVRS